MIAEPNYYSNALLLVNGHADQVLPNPKFIYNAELMQFSSLSEKDHQPDTSPMNTVGISHVMIHPRLSSEDMQLQKPKKKRASMKSHIQTHSELMNFIEAKQAKKFERQARPRTSMRAASAQRRKKPRDGEVGTEAPFEVHQGFTHEERNDLD